MERRQWPSGGVETSRIIYGCMNIGQKSREDAFAALDTALDVGIDCFDHADIYCGGESEKVFGQWLREHPGIRERLFIQSKCGIQLPKEDRPGMYDSSYDHILYAVEGILGRLGIDYLDLLFIHRPDPLMDEEDLAAAFDFLQRRGYVRAFGLSNHSSLQTAYLQSFLSQGFLAQQMEISLSHHDMISAGTAVNQRDPAYPLRDPQGLAFAQMNKIASQAWSPLGRREVTNSRLDTLLKEYAAAYGLEENAIRLAWLLRHPAGIFPVIGTSRPERIVECSRACEIMLGREEWYRLLEAARGMAMP